MGRFIEGYDRSQPLLLPAYVEDYVSQDSLVRVIDAFVETLDLTALGFERTVSAPTGRPGCHPGDMLRLYIWGYLNQLRSSRQLERACQRDLEAIWLMRRMTPDYRTIAAFRHDNPKRSSARGPHSSASVARMAWSLLARWRWTEQRCGRLPARRILQERIVWHATSLIPKQKSPTISTAST